MNPEISSRLLALADNSPPLSSPGVVKLITRQLGQNVYTAAFISCLLPPGGASLPQQRPCGLHGGLLRLLAG